MIIVILILAIALTAVGFYITVESYDFDFIGAIIAACGLAGVIVTIIAIVTCCADVSQLKVVDQKISMYQEENEQIETELNELVINYMEYESETLKDFKGEDVASMISLYPELKSDTLVQKQLEVYVDNNAKIKELKESKIDAAVSKWWLYFG